MTIVEFLRARYDEDEAPALGVPEAQRRWAVDGGTIYATHPTDQIVDWVYDDHADHIARHDPARVLADVEAKRRIVDRAELVLNAADGDIDPTSPSGGKWLAIPAARQEQRLVLRLLALPYADHADYDPAWRLPE